VQAEKGILPLNDNHFNIVVLRPPMIYGKGSKGDYPLLVKIAKKMPIFPYVKNERSVLYIENLCEFVRLMVENDEQGIFWLQNAEYSNTSEMVKMIAAVHGNKMRLIKGFGWSLKLLSYVTGMVNKAFGNLSYVQEISEYKSCYCKVSLSDSIKETGSDV
jgi:UDP-glucose 4-epimerase